MNLCKLHNDIHEGALQLLAEHRAQLLAKARTLCDNESDADELVIRTIDQSIRKIDTYSGEGDILSWMMSILVHIQNHNTRSPVVRGTLAVEEAAIERLAGADWKTDEEILNHSDGEAVRAALKQLDPEYRKIVLLRYYEDLSLKEIAGVLNKPIGTVGRRIHVALHLLAGKLSAELGKGKKVLTILLALALGATTLFGAYQTGLVDALKSFVSAPAAATESPLRDAAGTVLDRTDPQTFSNQQQEKTQMKLAPTLAAVAALSVGSASAADNLVGAETKKSSRKYVQRGLVSMWDGYENSGRFYHRGNATKWVDLVRGVEINLPDWVTAEEMSMFSKSALSNVSVKTNSLEGLSLSDEHWTLEVVQQSCGWKDSGNYESLQSVCSTPRGSLGYRRNKATGFYFFGPSSANRCSLQNWSHATANVADIHTMTAVLGSNARTSSIWMDAVQDTVNYSNDYNANWATYFAFFGNQRMDIRVYAIRIYNRELTDDEIKANHAVDVTRFVNGNYFKGGFSIFIR